MSNDPKSFLSTDGLQALIANIKASLGATDYDDLSDKPKLNNVTVQGNKTSTDFGLQDKIDNSHKLNADLIDDSESINKFVTAAEKAAWNKSVSYMSIPNNGDLNDYYGAENAGNYLCTDANVSTLSHKPSAITTAFRMDVIFYNDQTIQVIYPNDEKCVSFLRIYKNNTWSEWKESAIEMTILSYGNSTWDEFMKAYLLNSIVYCRAGSSTPQTSPQLRLAFMAYVNDEANPTEVEFQYYRSVSNKSDSAQGDEVYIYKLNKTNGWSNLKRNTYSKVAVAAPITKSYASNTVTIGHANSGVTAGTYDSVTVDEKGHVTAGSNYTVSQAEQDAEIAAVANAGAKNIADFNFGGVVQNVNVKPGTIVCTETNGIFSFSGASDNKNYAAYVLKQFLLKAGTYKISGASGGSNTTYYIRIGTGTTDTWLFNLYDAEKEFNIASDTLITAQVVIYANQTVSNLVFKPMIRPAAITDGTFVPYAKTNRELTVENASQQSEINYAVNTGAKNLFKNTAVNKTYLGVTFTVNGDGTVSLSGTATTAASVLEIGTVTPPAGSYIVSGCPAGGSWAPNPNKYRIRIAKNGAWLGDETGTGYTVTVNGSDVISLQINSAVGFDTAGLVFKPMIRPASITDSTFQPYALPNPVLTPAAIKAVDEGAKNHCTLASGSSTPPTRWIDIPVSDVGVGQWVMSFGTLTSTDTDDTFCQALCLNSRNQQVSNWVNFKRESNTNKIFTTTDTVSYIRLYPANSDASSEGDTVTFTNGMICTLADWNVSQKFVPYCPTNRELYESDKVIDISSQITAESGYTIESSTHLYYQNKQVFGTIAVAINSGSYSSSLTAIAKLPVEYAPARQYLGSCGFSTDQWAITNIGYAFIQGANASSTAQKGQISVKSPTANLTHMILNVCYPVQIDEVLVAT